MGLVLFRIRKNKKKWIDSEAILIRVLDSFIIIWFAYRVKPKHLKHIFFSLSINGTGKMIVDSPLYKNKLGWVLIFPPLPSEGL